MEQDLHVRDRVGVQDFVLLENHTSETEFIENLQKRSKEELIYTYIGSVLVSVNPYKNLPIYGSDYVEKYRNVNFYELPPHVFALTDTALRSLRGELVNQCILISGESGAGKTEASKKSFAIHCRHDAQEGEFGDGQRQIAAIQSGTGGLR